MNDNIQLQSRRKKIKNFIMMLISLFLSAFVYNLLLLPVNLVTGGTSGIATILNYIYRVDPATVLLILSIACIIISYMYLGKEETLATIAASFAYPAFVKITAPITNYIIIDYSDLLVITLFAGVLYGISNGMMYKSGYSNGGLPIISRILYVYKKIPIAISSTTINIIIVIISGFFFGWTNVMYAVILLYINGIIVNKYLLGISNNKAFYIISTEDEAIKDFIIRMLGHSVTVFDVKGGMFEKKRKVILTVIPTNEYYKVTEGIKMIDDKAFFLATDSYEVMGGK